MNYSAPAEPTTAHCRPLDVVGRRKGLKVQSMISTTPARTSTAYSSRNGGVNIRATKEATGSVPESTTGFATRPPCGPETDPR